MGEEGWGTNTAAVVVPIFTSHAYIVVGFDVRPFLRTR